jgi:hypothetical protein
MSDTLQADQGALRRPPTAAAHRMRRHRIRRQRGLRCLSIEFREREIAALIARGLLARESQDDSTAVRDALYAHLDRTLGGFRDA